MFKLGDYFSVFATVFGLNTSDPQPYVDIIKSLDFSNFSKQINFDPVELSENQLLFASPETLEMLGPLADRLTNWTGNIPVIVISAADFTPAQLDIETPDIEGIRDYIESLASNSGLPVDLVTDPIIRLMSKKMAVEEGENSALKGFSSEDDSAVEFCILVADTPPISGQDVLQDISGMPLDLIEFAPGTPEEWFTAIIRHEAAHCTQSVDHDRTAFDWGEILLREVDADQQMVDGHLREINNPVFPITANVAELLVLGRSIAIFNGVTAPTHMTAGGVHFHDHDAHNHAPITIDYMQEVGDIGRALKIRMAEIYGTKVDWLTGFQDTVKLFRNAQEMGDDPAFADLATAAKAFNDEFSEEEAMIIFNSSETFNELYTIFANHALFLEYTAALAGGELEDAESRSFYEQSYYASKTLVADGTFEEGSLGYRMMMQYQTALETFMPSVKDDVRQDLQLIEVDKPSPN